MSKDFKKLPESEVHYLPWDRFCEFVNLNGGKIDIKLIAPDDLTIFSANEFDCSEDKFLLEYPEGWLWAKHYHDTHELGDVDLVIFYID